MADNTVIAGVTYTWDELPTYVQDALNLVAKNLGFISPTFNIASGSNVGDGFMSVMQRVVIAGHKVNDTILNKGVKHEIRVLMKLPPKSKERREQFNSNELFEREIAMYNDFLPTIEQYQLKHGIQRYEGFFCFPHCYYAHFDRENDEAILILEDLGVTNFVMWSKYVPMDIFHATKVLEGIGRFHAMSFVLKKQEPELFKKFQQYKDPLGPMIVQDQMAEMWENYFDNAINAVPDLGELKQKLIEFKSNVVKQMQSLLSSEIAEPYAIVNHGDCWINNFMFQESEGQQPSEIAFIDFQVSRYVSPILDLMYFIFVSTDKTLRDEHYDQLLDVYYNTLAHTIRRFGENPEQLFPRSVFQQQLKDFGRFGLPMALMLIPVITTKPDELMDMDKVSEIMAEYKQTGVKSNEFLEMEKEWQKNVLKTQGRIRDVAVDMVKYGYL